MFATRLQDLPPQEAVKRFRESVLAAFASGNPEVRALLEDRASSDENVRRVYAGRFVFELLQNACDAHDRQRELATAGKAERPGPARALVQLTETHLLVANSGCPFSFDPLGEAPDSSGIHSICRYGASTKSSLRFKGQFGIGIKSVDEVSDEVFVASGGFRLRFNRERLKAALGEQAPRNVPLLYAPEWFEDDEAPSGALELAAHYDTVVALHLKAQDHLEIRQRLGEIGAVEVLLLETLSELAFVDQDRRTFTLEQEEEGPPERWRVKLGREGHADEVQQFLLFRAPIRPDSPQDHRIAWPLDDQGALTPLDHEARRFHTFYPVSREASGAPFLIHSYLRLDPSRKGLAEGTEEEQRNRELFEGVLDLVEHSFPILARQPRGSRPLHALIWPDTQASSPQGQVFVDRLRKRAWSWPIFEGYGGQLGSASEFAWPDSTAGLDDALEGILAGNPPCPRASDGVLYRPSADPPSATALAAWLQDDPPTLPSPERFARLLSALYLLVPPNERAVFQQAAQGAPVLPVRAAAGVRWIGLKEGTSVFLAAEGQELSVPASLEGLMRAHLLAEGALGEDPEGLALAAGALLGVRPLSPEELVESLLDSLEARGRLDQEEVLGALGFVVEVLAEQLAEVVEQEESPQPWVWDRTHRRMRQRLARIPLPLARRPARAADEIVVELVSEELSVLYPQDHGQIFLNEQTEHSKAKQLLARFGDWPRRRRVYAFLGAWPMPRLHAVDLPEGQHPALESPHPGISDEVWSEYVYATSSRTWFGEATVKRSVAWPDLPALAEHCSATGLLPDLLAQVARHARRLLEPRQETLWVKRNKYIYSFTHWQLRTTPWLPTTRQGHPAVPTVPAEAWWTEDVLDPAKLHEARWNHLPFAHAGSCPRDLAVLLGLPLYQEPGSPDPDTSYERTVTALNTLHQLAPEHDDPGLRRLYRELAERLADLRPTAVEGLERVLAVTGGGTAVARPLGEVYVDDLTTPLPLGDDSMALALFATGVQKSRRLARLLGVRLLSEQRIEYRAPDRVCEQPAEETLTAWLQWLRPYVFALRAYSYLVPAGQHIEFTTEAVDRYSLAQVEVVEGVELWIDGELVARQGAHQPVVLAHEPDERNSIPVFVLRSLAERHDHDSAKLLHTLARPAAELAGDPGLAHTVELLLLTIGTRDDVRAEAFLRDRCGVSALQLATAREACGCVSDARERAVEEAKREARRSSWQARTDALREPLLALLLVAGKKLRLRDVRARLEAHRDADDPLAAAQEAFAPLGVDPDHPVWALESREQSDAFLGERSELAQALVDAVSAQDAAAERRRVLENELQRARLVLLALTRSRAPEARIQELIAAWEELAERADPENPGALEAVVRAFLGQQCLGEELESAVLAPPEGRLWSGAHLTSLGLEAAFVTEVSIEVQRYLEGAQDIQARRERAYASWVRSQGLHRSVVRESPTLSTTPPPTPPAALPSEPAQELTMDSRGGGHRHNRRHRRNSLTGGLGEVFALMQELELWRALAPEARNALLDEVAKEYSDLKASEAVETVRAGEPSSDTWESALTRLLRIGDYRGARCDLLGVGGTQEEPRLRYLEVKATSRRHLEQFFLSAPEWEFLSDPKVRDRCAIVLVSNAGSRRTPRVEVIDRPAALLTPAASNYEVVLRRSE